MSSVFSVVAQYKDRLVLMPILVTIFVTATVLLYILFHKQSWVKYIAAAVGIAFGIAFLLFGFSMKTSREGLDWIWRGVSFFVAGSIALAASWLCTLIEGLTRPSNNYKNKKRKAGKNLS